MTSTHADSLDALAQGGTGSMWRRIALVVMALVAAAIAWTFLATFEEVAIANGEVVPQGQVKVIQHLEGGIVKDIHVREGEKVVAGQPLVQLDLASGGLNRKELEARIDGLVLKRARLAALIDGGEPDYESGAARRQPLLVAAENEALATRRDQLDSRVAGARARLDQRRQEVAELEARIASLGRSLPLAEERHAMALSLAEEKLIPRMELLEISRNLEELRGEVASVRAALPRARSAAVEAEEGIREVELDFRREVAEQMALVELEIAGERERMVRATDQQSRTVIASPIDGTVKNLAYHTIGGVVRPGNAIMEIVPARERLLIEARLDPRDIGHVRVGQPAVAKFTTYDFVRYGGLDGRVVNIAADADRDDAGRHYFRVVVETENAALGQDGELPIIPGMEATVDIHTGEKRVVDYLIQPVLKTRAEAFRER